MELFCNCYLDGVGLQFKSATSSPSGTGCFGALGDTVMLKLGVCPQLEQKVGIGI